MTYTRNLFFASILFCLYCSMTSCDSLKKEEYKNTDMYDLSKPTIINLPEELDEISGIAYYPKDTSVFAIIDEDGFLYKIPILHPNNLKKWRFHKQRDYEDIVLKDSVFYVLVSNGDIQRIKFEGDSVHTDKLDFSNTSKKTNEFETLFLTDSGHAIVMCKECEDDKKARLSAYLLVDSNATYLPYLEIDAGEVAKKLDKEKVGIKPSAGAINPVTGDLYVISSIEKILMIFDRRGKLKELYKLNPKIYKQPEGMAFTPAGDLIISNEVFLEGYANLLILKNKKKGK